MSNKKIIETFKSMLIKRGVLRKSGSMTVKGIEQEDYLLSEWKDIASKFICKNKRVSVDMRITRMIFEETRCIPIIDII